MAAHEAGALVLADSYQACGAVELDVRSLGADAVTGGTVKYLLGTAGLGFMWVRPGLHETLVPTQTGWFADEDIFAMSIADYSPHRSARRFDSGTPPVPSLYAGVAGLSLVSETGVPSIQAHVLALGDRLLDGLDELGAAVVTPARRRTARASRLRALDRRRGARRARSPPSGSSSPRARTSCASPCTCTTSRRTSTRSSPRSPATRRCSREHRTATGRGADR